MIFSKEGENIFLKGTYKNNSSYKIGFSLQKAIKLGFYSYIFCVILKIIIVIWPLFFLLLIL